MLRNTLFRNGKNNGKFASSAVTKFAAPLVALLALTACDESMAPSAGVSNSASVSNTMMSRAQTLASKGGITSAQLNEAYNTGTETKSVAGSAEGKRFEESCLRLKSATDTQAGLGALGVDTSTTFAKCAGFLS